MFIENTHQHGDKPHQMKHIFQGQLPVQLDIV